jgi:ubiquinone/menaquinone biosynthesis C-methylase UbiE
MEDLGRMAAAFDELAGDYDNAYHDEIARALVAFVAPAVTGSVADVACGTGAVALEVARKRPAGAAPVLAIDVSAAMVAAGKSRAGSSGDGGAISWRIAPAVPLPVADASLDVILCASSLHFLGTGALADWRRALRPGGRIGFTLPLAAQFRPSGAFAALVANDLPLPATADAGRALVEAAGFVEACARLVAAGGRRTVVVAATRPATDRPVDRGRG